MGKQVVWFIYIYLAIIGVFNIFSPMLLTNFAHIVPDPGDAVFNSITFEHVYKSFFEADYKGTFFSPIFFYPHKLILTFSDHHLGSAPIYWLFRIFFDPLFSFQLWEVVVCLLTYFAYIAFLRELKVSPFLAGVISFIFSFGTFRVLTAAHPQLYPQFYTPIFWIFLMRFIKKPDLKILNLSMLFLYLQFMASYYLGWYLLLSLCIFAVIYCFSQKTQVKYLLDFVKSNGRKVILWFLFWGILYAVIWAPYVYTSIGFKVTKVSETYFSQLPTIANYFYLPPGGIYDWLLNGYTVPMRSGFGEYMFLGLCGLLIVSFGVYLFRIKKEKLSFEFTVARQFYILALILTVLALKIGDYSLWYLIYKVFPGADAIRYPFRIWLISFFYLFAGFGIVLSKSEFSKKIYFPLILLLLLIEQMVIIKPSADKNEFLGRVNKITVAVTQNKCDVFYFKPVPDAIDNFMYLLVGMRASLDTNIPIINGYSGFSYGDVHKELDALQLSKLLGNSYSGNLCYIKYSSIQRDVELTTYTLPLDQN